MSNRYDLYITANNIDEKELAQIRGTVLRVAGVTTDVSVSSSVIPQLDDAIVSSNRFAHPEPTEPGFYKYSGGAQSLLFHLDASGQWWIWAENTSVTKCDWGYIEQALGVWNLEKI